MCLSSETESLNPFFAFSSDSKARFNSLSKFTVERLKFGTSLFARLFAVT